MNHRATPRFWSCYHRLPDEIRRLADRNYELLRYDPAHPSLHLKNVGTLGRFVWGCITEPWQSRMGQIFFGCGSDHMPSTTN